MAGNGNGSCLVVGNQRSYSDVCRNSQGTIAKAGNRILEYEHSGWIRCQAGITVRQLALLLDWGWRLPVMPGTGHATVGGCIANDVHGKNHQREGSFGNHVIAIRLARSDGKQLTLYPEDDLFCATVGGLGLTGRIIWAELKLKWQSMAFKPWLFPLDYIPWYWQAYKRLGFWQYHCVVPGSAVKPLMRLVTQRPLLLVKKRFGDIPPIGLLSFCRPGISISMDFARPDPKMQFNLDMAVMDCGGAVYPAKTSMSAAMFRHSFPCWRGFARYVDPGYSSDFWRRVSA